VSSRCLAIAALSAPIKPADRRRSFGFWNHALPTLLVATGSRVFHPGLGQINERVFFFMIGPGKVLPNLWGWLFLGGAIGRVIQGRTVVAAERKSNQNFELSPVRGLKASFFRPMRWSESVKSIGQSVGVIGGLAHGFTE